MSQFATYAAPGSRRSTLLYQRPRPSLKGLTNPAGASNCFLNSVVQSLWHLDAFRTAFSLGFLPSGMSPASTRGRALEHLSETLAAEGSSWRCKCRRQQDKEEDGEQAKAAKAANASSSKLSSSSIFATDHDSAGRGDFSELDGSPAAGDNEEELKCAFCSLRWIFTMLQHHPSFSIPADSLRVTLSLLHEGRFQLNEMEDAIECFEAILGNLHDNCQSDESSQHSQTAAAPADQRLAFLCCPGHAVCGLDFTEQRVCDRGHTSAWEHRMTTFVHYVLASKLTEMESVELELDAGVNSLLQKIIYADVDVDKRAARFEGILHSMLLGETSPCSDHEQMGTSSSDQQHHYRHHSSSQLHGGGHVACDSIARIKVGLKRVPSVFPTGIVWPSMQISQTDIMRALHNISPFVDLANVFDTTASEAYPEHSRVRTRMYLQGMIAFYGQHYVGFFYSHSAATWTMFDDSLVKDVGPTWHQHVLKKCIAGRFAPSLLLYSSWLPETDVSFRPTWPETNELERINDHRTQVKKFIDDHSGDHPMEVGSVGSLRLRPGTHMPRLSFLDPSTSRTMPRFSTSEIILTDASTGVERQLSPREMYHYQIQQFMLGIHPPAYFSELISRSNTMHPSSALSNSYAGGGMAPSERAIGRIGIDPPFPFPSLSSDHHDHRDNGQLNQQNQPQSKAQDQSFSGGVHSLAMPISAHSFPPPIPPKNDPRHRPQYSDQQQQLQQHFQSHNQLTLQSAHLPKANGPSMHSNNTGHEQQQPLQQSKGLHVSSVASANGQYGSLPTSPSGLGPADNNHNGPRNKPLRAVSEDNIQQERSQKSKSNGKKEKKSFFRTIFPCINSADQEQQQQDPSDSSTNLVPIRNSHDSLPRSQSAPIVVRR